MMLSFHAFNGTSNGSQRLISELSALPFLLSILWVVNNIGPSLTLRRPNLKRWFPSDPLPDKFKPKLSHILWKKRIIWIALTALFLVSTFPSPHCFLVFLILKTSIFPFITSVANKCDNNFILTFPFHELLEICYSIEYNRPFLSFYFSKSTLLPLECF